LRSHHPYAIITIIFWSLAYVLTRLALECFSAPSLGFLRYFVAAVVMAALALKFRIRPPQKSDLVWFLLSGMTGISLYMPAFNKGCETASAAESSVLIATVPVLTAIMAKFIHKENLRPFQ
jgi:drug/metabolite transporter (DMT)-like permease